MKAEKLIDEAIEMAANTCAFVFLMDFDAFKNTDEDEETEREIREETEQE